MLSSSTAPRTTSVRLVALAAALSLLLGACREPAGPALVDQVEIVAAPDTTTVGAAAEVRVRVLDAAGRSISGSPVTFVPLTAGGGAGEEIRQSTGDGIASFQWTVPTAAGLHQLRVETTGPSSTVQTVALAGPAATLTMVSGDGQSGSATQELSAPLVVAVTDVHDNPVAGALVRWAVRSGGGSLDPDSVASGADGRASTTFTLGGSVGQHEATATVTGVDSVTFTASAAAGPPASMERVAGDGQSATAGSPILLAPRVRVLDNNGIPVPGATVTFAATAGGGSVSGATQSTGLDGTAAVGSWTLGTQAGLNTLAASVTGAPAITFSATGVAGPATTVVRSAGDGQNALTGATVAVDPEVFVSDQHGNAVSGISVTFAVTGGGGSATGTSATTDGDGRARVGSWTLGATPGTNTLQAMAAGLGSVTFTATATESTSGFSIDLEVVGPISPAALADLEAAFSRWERVIVGDLPDVTDSRPAGFCGVDHDAFDGTVDDLHIFVQIDSIDGPLNVLGAAGPCVIRSDSKLPVLGVIWLDSADVRRLQDNGQFDEVILHEVGHVLGIGSLWSNLNLIQGEGGADPIFTGSQAIQEFEAAGGSPSGQVPVENTGGGGTRDSHWREEVLVNELMTGWLNPSANPLSAITIGSLQDMGYVVDAGEAEPYTVPGGPVALQMRSGPALELVEVPLPAPVPVSTTRR